MGFIDKLRDKVDSIKETISIDESLVKRYYGVILILLSHIKYLTKENILMYFKVKYNEECDEAAFNKALSKFKATTEYGRTDTWYCLTFDQYKNKKEDPSIDKDDILNACFMDFINEVKIQFEKILDEIDDSSLDEEIRRFDGRLNIPHQNGYPVAAIVGRTMGEIMVERLLNEDPIVVNLVGEEICNYIIRKKGLHRAYAIAIRAYNFRNFYKNSDEYKSIDENICYDAVVKSRTFIKEVEEKSLDKNKSFAQISKSICKSDVLAGRSEFDWKYWVIKDVCFLDAACYYAVEKMADKFIDGDTRTVEGMVDLIASFVAQK